MPGALEFLSRLPIEPGTRMLDVACGAGQKEIPMARAGAQVTAIDIATNLIEQPWTEHNTATDGGTSLEAEYLEVVAIRQ